MRVWPVHRPTHAPATALKTNGNSAPPQNQKPKPLVLPLHRRLRLAGRSSGQHMLPQQPSKQTATAPPYKTKNLNPSCCRSTGGCGWLAGPPANTCSRNSPQNKRRQHPNHRHSGIFRAARPRYWNDAARKISGISRASGLPRPHFHNADPVRHAPCHFQAGDLNGYFRFFPVL